MTEGAWRVHDGEGGDRTGHAVPKDARKAAKCNLLARLFLLWLDPLFWTGSCQKGSLDQSDLYAHPGEADSEKLLIKFNRYWEHELRRRPHGQSARLWVPIIKCVWWRSMLQAALYIVEVMLLTGQALVIGYLVESLSSDDQDVQKSYLYAAALPTLILMLAIVHVLVMLIGKKVTMMARIILTAAVYQKVLRMNQVTLGRVTTGHVINLASNDVHRVESPVPYFPHLLWLGPLHLVLITCLVYNEIGSSALVATGYVLLQIPVQIIAAKVFAKLRLKSALLTDNRVRVMNEVICGMRVIKMYAWEYAFKRVVSKIRQKECFLIFKSLVIRAIQQGNATVSITVLAFLIFVTHAARGGEVNPRNVFTTLSLLYQLRTTIYFGFVASVLDFSEMNVAMKRIQKMLLLDEQNSGVHNHPSVVWADESWQNLESNEKDPESAVTRIGQGSGLYVSIEGLSASWSGDVNNLTLRDISCALSKEQPLLIVSGPVGSGKSSLLQCILGELKPLEGNVVVHGKITYASQEPWVFSGSLRENILFGQPFQKEWYNVIIKACSLLKDICLMEHGDHTLIGERGVTLSGGQKARVSLARAIYNKTADVYLLDDPLSAVDAKVAKNIFEEVICDLLGDKMVILVTHQVQFAEKASRILALKEGEVEAYGSHAELQSRGIDPSRLLGLKSKEVEDLNEFVIREDFGSNAGHGESEAAQMCSRYSSGLTPLTAVMDDRSIYSSESVMSLQSISKWDNEEPQLDSEDKGSGRISVITYLRFLGTGASWLVLLVVLILFITAQGASVVADWWLSNWAGCSEEVNATQSATCGLSTTHKILVYTGVTAFAIIMNFVRTVSFYAVCVNASRVLHNRMFASILRAPMRFFDTNPSGRVVNRFSKDQGFLDDLIPYLLCETLLWVTYFVAVVLTTVISNVWMLIPLVLLCTLILPFRWYYLKTSREIKRLESIARSPLYSHISMTIHGLPTIRAFRMESVALGLFHKYQNEHTQGWWLYILGSRWFLLRLNCAVAIFVAIVALTSVPLSSSINPTLIGLSLVYVQTLFSYLGYCVRVGAEAENLMVSAKRVMEYGQLQSEAPLETLPMNRKPPPNWPHMGEIEVDEVSFRYADSLPMVFKSLSFSVLPTQKIGVVGRTGAGKSSLMSVLFRLGEYHGTLSIDGVNVKQIGLHDLRSRISIIPQDPVLFSGTVRYNLDPFDEYGDQELWTALEQVELKSVVQELDGQLHAEVSEGGTNFSVGQKQLVCLARALLRNNKILILDEATANVDVRTDEIIQATIRWHFSACTVITIAHRLNTVIDSDKILVMDNGEVREFDSPYTLLQDPRSQFRKMVEETGPTASRKLYQVAAEAQLISTIHFKMETPL